MSVIVEDSQQIDRPSDLVWGIVSNHRGMPQWSPARRVVMDAEGAHHPDGLGAIRRIYAFGPPVVEQIVGWDPPYAYDYQLLRGAPIRNHIGRVTVAPAGDTACTVTWRIEFEPIVMGTRWVLRMVVRGVVRQMLEGINRMASRSGDRVP